MIQKFLIIGLLLSMSGLSYSMSKGCSSSSAVCKIGKQAIAMMASTTGVTLGCQNLAEVQADFDKQFQRWGVCPDASAVGARSIGSDICNTLGTFVLQAAVGGAIPAKWECNPTATVDMLKAAINQGCVKIFP